MDVTFLEARIPLTKTFKLNAEGIVEGTHYPNVRRFTSHTESVDSLSQFHQAISQHAAQGHCLLKGNVFKPLKQESRAGSTNATTQTEWLCLDADGIEGIDTPLQLLKLLGLESVDHIVQYSSSAGVNPNKTGLSAHIFLLLEEPATPEQLKRWLIWCNLHTPKLRSQLKLSRSGAAIRWPLDISVGQNDKLLFIAPPVLGPGVPNTLRSARIQLKKRSQRKFRLPVFADPTEIHQEQLNALNALRQEHGLPERKETPLKTLYGTEVLKLGNDNGPVEVTGYREDRGFAYLNLNGGDSWGYYHPLTDPKILFNFKGEPNYLTRELLPGYYEKAKLRSEEAKKEQRLMERTAEAQRAAEARQPEDPKDKHSGKAYLAFRDLHTDAYYNGWYDYATDELTLVQASSRTKLVDFAVGHGMPAPDFIPDWKLEFRTGDMRRFIPTEHTINTFNPSEYWRNAKTVSKPKVPALVDKILRHVLNDDAESYEHFLNWLACLLQYRVRTGTAWILHGTMGTGKGVLFNHILRPLLGPSLCTSMTLDRLEENYTGFLRNTLLLFIDEANFEHSKGHRKLMERLRNWITEDTLKIRDLYVRPFDTENYCNFIFASNTHHAMEITRMDRRFNVAPRQETPIKLSRLEIETLRTELQGFANYLVSRKADLHRAKTPMDNQAKQDMREITEDSPVEVVEALKAGDLQYFYDLLPNHETDIPVSNDLGHFYGQFIDSCFQACISSQGVHRIPRDTLAGVFLYAVGWVRDSPSKFTKALKRYGLPVTPQWVGGQSVRGICVNWKYDKALLAAWGARRGKPKVSR